MKFAWKVTLVSLCTLVLSMGVGSYLLISLSFRSALTRETDVAQEEMQMLRVTFEAVCNNKGVTLENLGNRKKSLERTLKESAYFENRQFRVSTVDGSQVYSTLSTGSDKYLLSRIDSQSTGYILRQEGPRVLIHCAGPVSLPDGFLYMETVRDITSLFSDREIHYQTYRYILLIVAAVGGGVMFALSHWLTTPIRGLQKVTNQLAEGDYSPRAEVGGGDEISELARNFNRMADAIERNIQALEDAARRQEDFTASFVHELKTPLTSIIGYADMLRSSNLGEDQRFKAASYIFSEGKRLENLSLSLMTLLVVGHSSAEVKTVNMRRLCEEAGRICLPAMEAKGLGLTVRADEGGIPGDPALLQTLIQNLLDNARKASNAGGEVSLEGESLEQGYRLRVTDHGRGIPENELGKITEAFYMVDKSRSRAEGGAGLGLALCKRIATIHGGSLRFDSVLGVGTTVTAELKGADYA